jgi:hypothetical protein
VPNRHGGATEYALSLSPLGIDKAAILVIHPLQAERSL